MEKADVISWARTTMQMTGCRYVDALAALELCKQVAKRTTVRDRSKTPNKIKDLPKPGPLKILFQKQNKATIGVEGKLQKDIACSKDWGKTTLRWPEVHVDVYWRTWVYGGIPITVESFPEVEAYSSLVLLDGVVDVSKVIGLITREVEQRTKSVSFLPQIAYNDDDNALALPMMYAAPLFRALAIYVTQFQVMKQETPEQWLLANEDFIVVIRRP